MSEDFTKHIGTSESQHVGINLDDAAYGLEIINQVAPNNAIVLNPDGTRCLGSFTLHKRWLDIPDDVCEDDMSLLGQMLIELDDDIQFLLGDWANWYLPDTDNDNTRGAANKALATRFNMDVSRLKDYASVSRKLPVSLRKDTLTFSHHKEVAFMPNEIKGREDEFLTLAIAEKLSVRELRTEIRRAANNEIKTVITHDLFDNDRRPNTRSLRLHSLFVKAKGGDKEARNKLLAELDDITRWADEVRDSI